MASSKTLTAACYCRNVQFTVTVPTVSLPLKVHLCHCSICRYTHGTLCCFHVPLPDDVQPEFIVPSTLNECTAYEHLTSTKYFCSTCGCQIGDRGRDGEWVISNAIFDANRDDSGIWQFNTHYDPRSTPDGGLSALFSSVEGRKLHMADPKPSPSTTMTKGSELLAQCHCGGVSFKISRPSEDFISSPNSQGWIHPSDKTKWLAGLDICDDCRLVNGTHVIGWMFVPLDHISSNPSTDLMIGSSKSFRSTPDVLRTFCGTCGATVFYSCKERPTVVDVAIGILRASEGAMAETWAVWRAGRVSGLQDGLKYHAGFATALIEGMQEWRISKEHPEDFILP
ncbi:uncharacterized protein N7443_005614 [Penicillium atrosanguineum]|uniref:uncharacterized protein n=1 Tax=Penicillium atrosanguineum TaxID=1132637 RepID=UPI00238E11C9|nr:uncharacterized protein N7443_005614 [Penicillium atrosanguineum]KAJ5300612.1 hypothetical protein N7443_005614 [Penicillium atrosanguineum]